MLQDSRQKKTALADGGPQALHNVSTESQAGACIPCIFLDTRSVYHGSERGASWDVAQMRHPYLVTAFFLLTVHI